MWKKLEIDDYLPYTVISAYERGLREPSLEIVLKYARLAGVQMEVLVDDALDLPACLPASVEGKRRGHRAAHPEVARMHKKR
jgi:hypothetical protein